MGAQPVDSLALDGASRADPDIWSEALAVRLGRQEPMDFRRSCVNGLCSLAAVVAGDRCNGSIFVESRWRLAARSVLYYCFSSLALLGLFLAGASGDGHLQRSPRPQHHVRCLVRWLIWVGSGPRGGASCRWTAGTVLSFTTAGFPESCRQLIETGSSGDKREVPRESEASRSKSGRGVRARYGT